MASEFRVTIYFKSLTSVKAELEYQKSRYQVKRSQSAEFGRNSGTKILRLIDMDCVSVEM